MLGLLRPSRGVAGRGSLLCQGERGEGVTGDMTGVQGSASSCCPATVGWIFMTIRPVAAGSMVAWCGGAAADGSTLSFG